MLSLQEISDRMEIQDLVYRYSELIDRKQFDGLREVFTEDHPAWTVVGVQPLDRGVVQIQVLAVK